MSSQNFSPVRASARRPTTASQRSRGVTLVELIVCISMLAALIGLAIPSFSSQLSGWRRDSAIHEFMGDLQLARSTAIRTSRTVVMCLSVNGNACTNSNDWRQSRIVFSDLNGNGVLDNGETRIVQRESAVGLQRMRSSINTGQIVFRSNGMLSSGNSTVEVLPNGADETTLVGIRINRTGRASLLQLGEV